jgi:hypothetical protein
MAVIRRHISPAAVRMEIERLVAGARDYTVEVSGRRMMIACLIAFNLLPASQYPEFSDLLAACDPKTIGNFEGRAAEPQARG